MNRRVVALAIGTGIAAVIGIAAVFTRVTEHSSGARSAGFEFDTGSPAGEHAATASAAADRAAASRRAAAASRSDVEALVAEAAAERPSARRTAELEALLGRFAELDPQAAIGVALGG
jgi:hypothetical protein